MPASSWNNRPDQPVAGYYETRLVRGGVWVPVHIWKEGDLWQALIDGEPYSGTDFFHLWVWCMGHPIPEAEYRYLLARSRHAKRWAPEAPAADPRRPVDWLKVKLPRARSRP